MNEGKYKPLKSVILHLNGVRRPIGCLNTWFEIKLPSTPVVTIETPQLDQWSKYCKSTPRAFSLATISWSITTKTMIFIINDTINSLSVFERTSHHKEIDSKLQYHWQWPPLNFKCWIKIKVSCSLIMFHNLIKWTLILLACWHEPHGGSTNALTTML